MAEYGHYTTLAGLKGIVEREQLWATNIRYLNDEQEYEHALKLIVDLLPQSKLKSGQFASLHAEYLGYIQETIESLKEYYASDSLFTLSFTQEIDLLSQWRGYCPGNSGYCMVFDVEKLLKDLKLHFKDVRLVECVYDKEEKLSALKKLLNDVWARYRLIDDRKERRLLVRSMRDDIVILASYFKDESFAEERESRIVVIVESTYDCEYLKFREGKWSLIPYLELPASRKFIKKYVIGPTAHKRLAHRSLEMFLERTHGESLFGFGDTYIEYSKTPYRPW